ncbi:MAG: nucleotidyl transferase AbiEii/AbiGii toxin family protein [Nitrospiraceae bacterium]|nr:MAG: nucleotidyl transferase AbiEii/AbiGii toxin family protein [Nitrospiraceae bacterium]
MITTAELHRLSEEEGLRFDQTEKDYVILWLLSGLVHSGMTKHGWVFKGGTCLRHCYYKGYRFSEDIDFSCKPGGDNLSTSLQLLQKAADRVQSESGIRLTVREAATIPGDFQIEIPVEYSRGGSRRRGLPQVKVHLTFDEPILEKPVICSIKPQYSDLSHFKVYSYSKKEIVAEKLRSLLQQQKKWPRPRDLYDLWYMLCRYGEHFTWKELQPLLQEKCRVREIKPDTAGLTSAKLKEWNKNAWRDRLGPMLNELPDFDLAWKEWTATFHKIAGKKR